MTRKRPKPGPPVWGICPLCHAETWLQQEHVLPWWAVCLFPEGTLSNTWEGQVVSQRPEGLNVLLRLCTPCNRRLGKKFEEPASIILKSMIWGGLTDPLLPLTCGDQVTIARWILKTVMLRAHEGRHTVPEFLWEWLRTGGQPRGMAPPPSGTRIWIAKQPRMTQQVQRIPKGTLPSRTELRFDWSGPLFYFGELAMFVLHQRVETDEVVAHPAEDLGFLLRVFPEQQGTISWPPDKSVGREDLIQVQLALRSPGSHHEPTGLRGISF